MEQFIKFTIDITDRYGSTNIIMFCLILTVFFLILLYFSFVLESYYKGGNLISFLKFKKYEVNVMQEGKIKETFVVRAFGTIHATEKVAKKIDRKDIQKLRFHVQEHI